MQESTVSVITPRESETNRALVDFVLSQAGYPTTSTISGSLTSSIARVLPKLTEKQVVENEVKDHTELMTDMNREELKAHLENQDLKVDARLKSFEQTVKDAMSEIRLDSVESKGELKALHADLSSLKNVKSAVWGAAGATILGVGGIMAAMLSFGVASFDTGRETSQLVEAAKQQSQQTKALLEQIQAQQKEAASKSATPPATKSGK